MFVYIRAHFCFALIGRNLTAQLTGSHRGLEVKFKFQRCSCKLSILISHPAARMPQRACSQANYTLRETRSQIVLSGIVASLHLCLLVISFPCQPDVFLTVSDPTAELSSAIIFATVYVLRSHTSWLWLVSNHNRSNHDCQNMSENPGVYIVLNEISCKKLDSNNFTLSSMFSFQNAWSIKRKAVYLFIQPIW